MFDIGWSELFVIAVVALVVIGPKDLPKVLRTVGKWIGKAKRVSYDFRRHVDDMIRESELDDVRRQITDVAHSDPHTLVQNTIDPDKKIREALEFGGEELVNVKLPDSAPTAAPAAPVASAAPAAIERPAAPAAADHKEPAP